MNRITIDPTLIRSGRFANMRREAQLLYFYLATLADDSGRSDVTVACSLSGTDFIEVRILIDRQYISTCGEDSTLVNVNGISMKDDENLGDAQNVG